MCNIAAKEVSLNPLADDADAIRPTSLARLAQLAERLQALMHAADVLTERPHLHELDRLTLDRLLIAGRDNATELVWRIEKLSARCASAAVPPTC